MLLMIRISLGWKANHSLSTSSILFSPTSSIEIDTLNDKDQSVNSVYISTQDVPIIAFATIFWYQFYYAIRYHYPHQTL